MDDKDSPTAISLTDAPQCSRTVIELGEAEDRIPFKVRKDFGFLPIPPHLRLDAANPVHFGLLLNIAFGLASTFTIANLYYCQPLLIQLSLSFNAANVEVSRIPTLIQAGYAVGLVLISPLGDLVRRRPLILATVGTSTALTVGLVLTRSLVVFETLSFFIGVASVTPQFLVILAADLAQEKRRAAAISIVLSGCFFGILIARVLAGIIAQFVTRCYAMLPDYPSKNNHLTYFNILWTMGKFAVTEPILVQACVIHICSNAVYSNFWITLTFLLDAEPYNYSTFAIGLSGLVGIAGVATGPIGGKVVNRFVPWYGSLVCLVMLAIFQGIQPGRAV